MTESPSTIRRTEDPETARDSAGTMMDALGRIDSLVLLMNRVRESEPGSCHAGDNRKSPRFVPSVTIQHSLVGALHCMLEFQRVTVEGGETSTGVTSRPFGQIAIVRQALDMCALAGWLMNSNNRDERIRRVFRLERENVRLSDSALKSLGQQPDRSREEKWQELQEIFAETSVEGLDLNHNGSALPRTTDMLKEIEKATWTTPRKYLAHWQLASGFAHGMPWAFTQVAALEEVAPHENSASSTFNVTINMTTLAMLASSTVLLLEDLVELFRSRSIKLW